MNYIGFLKKIIAKLYSFIQKHKQQKVRPPFCFFIYNEENIFFFYAIPATWLTFYSNNILLHFSKYNCKRFVVILYTSMPLYGFIFWIVSSV